MALASVKQIENPVGFPGAVPDRGILPAEVVVYVAQALCVLIAAVGLFMVLLAVVGRLRRKEVPTVTRQIVSILGATTIALGLVYVAFGLALHVWLGIAFIPGEEVNVEVAVALLFLVIALLGLCYPLIGIGSVNYSLNRNLRDIDEDDNASRRCRPCIATLAVLTFMWATLATIALMASLGNGVDLDDAYIYEDKAGIATITDSEMYVPFLYQTPTYLLLIWIPSSKLAVTIFTIVAAAFDLTLRFATNWSDGVLGLLPVIVLTLFPLCYVRRRDDAIDEPQPNEAQLP